MRILAVDPGEQHLGLAVCDPTGLAARGLTTLTHVARAADAERIAALAAEQQAEMILVGQALDADGQVGPQARRAERLAEAIRLHTALPVQLWDESFSTQAAEQARPRRRRPADRNRVHAAAAAAILQSYLDAHSPSDPPPA